MIKKITNKTNRAKEYFLDKISFEIGPYELKDMIQNEINNLNIVDVRTYDDYIDGHIPYAIHVPFDSIKEHMVMFDKEKLNIVYCYNNFCKLGHKAAYILTDNSYPTMLLSGGYATWQKFGFDIIKTSSNNDK